MKRLLLAAALIGVASGCASLSDAGNGVVALQIRTPDSLFLYKDSSLTLQASALNLAGNPVPATILWTTSDTGLITVDSTAGIITSKVDSFAVARVQAHTTDSLFSDPITITLRKDTTTASSLIGHRAS